MDTERPGNALENALVTADDGVETRQAFLQALVKARIFVVLEQPWDGYSLPSMENRLMFVTDGANTDLAMLAVFTSKERAEAFVKTHDSSCKYPVEVDTGWALLGIPDQGGMYVNPNSKLNFRISPEVAGILRDTVRSNLSRRMNPNQAVNSA